jgi:hypothetical protein
MYESKGGKHALVDNVNTIDTLSYISVCLFVHVYGNRLFTNDCSAGGKLYAHTYVNSISRSRDKSVLA